MCVGRNEETHLCHYSKPPDRTVFPGWYFDDMFATFGHNLMWMCIYAYDYIYIYVCVCVECNI